MSAFASLMTPGWVKFIGGWRAFGFALCALVAVSYGGCQRVQADKARLALARTEAALAREIGMTQAALAIAADYEARAEKARAELAEATKAMEVQKSARARKWERVRQAEPEWSEVEVPDAVVEALE